ncbi:MAG: response regulator [Deltaproteobacteria bacterium]
MSRTVLVVDDSRASRELIAAALEGLDLPEVGEVEVVQGETGFDALRLLSRHRLDLVISDVNMPDLHGFELLRLLRADDRTRSVPIILVSSQAGEREVRQGLALGATEFLAKPLDGARLLAIGHRYLCGRAAP